MLQQDREDSIVAVPGQVIYALCATTGADGPDSTEDSGVAAGEAPAILGGVLASRTVEVPQLQSSTEFDDELEANGQFLTHFASFFALLQFSGVERHGAVFQPSMMKSSSSSRAPWGAGVAGSFTPR